MLAAALTAAGKTPDFGRVLAPTYLAAGLPLPVVEAITPIATGPESPVFDWLARTLHNLRPVFDRTGDRLPAGLDFDNLTEHWQRVAAEGVQMQGPVQYGAWTRVP